MAESYVFHPPRRGGLFYQIVILALLVSLGVGGMELAARAEKGSSFLLALALALAAIAFVPWIAYDIYALLVASYTLERGGIRLQWGLRIEEIPMNAVRWMHPASQVRRALPLPWLHWPGALLGVRRFPDGTQVEFLATRPKDLIVIGVGASTFAERCFVISPAHPNEFLATFQHLTELGTFDYLPVRSAQPIAMLTYLWADLPARLLMIVAFFLSLGLFTWVALAIPGRSHIYFGFGSVMSPPTEAPAVRLILLPVLNGVIFAFDLLLGLFFYRRSEGRIAAYLLWLSSIVSALLFLGAVYFILQASPSTSSP